MTKKTEILIEVELDENKIPEKINWTAEDGGVENEETKSIMISIWDAEKREALRIDLWTKEMPVDHMKLFYHQTLVAMATNYERATDDKDVAEKIALFAEEFADLAAIKK